MPQVKKLVMQGFKSFVRKTEIPFDNGINVILGPNGSGKSNVSDALCFVLGRLSIKSMRAAKAKNLIFMGTKAASPAKEAIVEIVFDNSDKGFGVDEKEISIKRIVRRNGQSMYKINNETKTRQDILTLLAQAGIDPHGYNIILQGEIQNIAKMHTEERRKIIEEVSGISVYESRKKKALRELEKTEDRLKEVLAILRERTSHLNNLEKERQQALRFKKLEKDVKVFKASIINYDLNLKKKETTRINEEIAKENKQLDKIKKIIISIKSEIENFEGKINTINSTIQQSTGFEQEKLNKEIADLRAELAGLTVRSENYNSKLNEISRKKQDLAVSINDQELTIKQLYKEKPTNFKTQKDIEKKKKDLELLEEERKKFYVVKSELKSIKDRVLDKSSFLQSYSRESEFLVKQIESLSLELFDKKSDADKLSKLKNSLENRKQDTHKINLREIELEKNIHTFEYEIKKLEKLKDQIEKMDICPLCKNKITAEHINSINGETDPEIKQAKEGIAKSESELNNIYQKRDVLNKEIEEITSEISKRESDVIKMSTIEDKKSQLKNLQEKIDQSKQELSVLEKRMKTLETNFDENSDVEKKYETARVEMQEISLISEENVDSEISFKQRELERSKIELKQCGRDEEDFSGDLEAITKDILEKEAKLEVKRKKEEELVKKFNKLIGERDSFQIRIRNSESELIHKQNSIRDIELHINNFNIDNARVKAEIENLEIEILEFNGVEIIRGNKENLTQRLNKAKDLLSRIGSVNLRSLEVYDSIKKEYETVKDKVDIISKEKEGILKIVKEIDIKKKKAFKQTLEAINELFSRNFSQLSTKGHVFLEMENRKDPFEGGVNIVVKVGNGKYFDVTSLSGGEQTLVALSLIFAIQEYNPYCFYILDEIDAALDKRNSERLANLLRKYMQNGQYIVITHNDEIISNATNIFGVSMHDGVSKVISLKL